MARLPKPVPEDGSVIAVVINYNGGDTVLRCLDSLKSQDYPNLKVIVVDNASTDGSAGKIGAAHPEARLILTGINGGWGIGCNIGMAAAESEFIALVNNDAWLDPACISEMVKSLRLKKEYGSCASKILTAEGNRLEVCGLHIVADGSSCGRGRLREITLFSEADEVFCANDCVCLYKREMINDIGDYDPDFFIYCDETDMGFKHQLAGWRCIYNPKALAYHAHSLTAGSYSAFKAFHVERNRILILFKYFPIWWILWGTTLSLWRYLLWVWMARRRRHGALAKYLEGNSMGAGFKVLLRAHFSALRLAPRMFGRRFALKRIRRIDSAGFQNLFRQYGISIRAMAEYE